MALKASIVLWHGNVGARRFTVMREEDEEFGVSTDRLSSREKGRIKRRAPRVIELVAERQASQGPSEQGVGIFDLSEIANRI
jgi:hypothetical protein